jgi:hypothetical protein
MLPKSEKLTVEHIAADLDRYTDMADELLDILRSPPCFYHRVYVRRFYNSVMAVRAAQSRLLWHLKGDANDQGTN